MLVLIIDGTRWRGLAHLSQSLDVLPLSAIKSQRRSVSAY